VTLRSDPNKNATVWLTIASPSIRIEMKTKLVLMAVTAAMVGCSTNRSPPVDVRLIPNDCANRTMIINYLDQEAKQPRGTFESEKDYEKHRAEIRQRIWTMRYYCQPV